ncbi:MAG: hypothetical protein M1828_007074 [Chrysothrix sp. TS-e1954]|nr:MAG: hypothetical protein M1828_007074 [Chrysothrix sp. TS-e1954]
MAHATSHGPRAQPPGNAHNGPRESPRYNQEGTRMIGSRRGEFSGRGMSRGRGSLRGTGGATARGQMRASGSLGRGAPRVVYDSDPGAENPFERWNMSPAQAPRTHPCSRCNKTYGGYEKLHEHEVLVHGMSTDPWNQPRQQQGPSKRLSSADWQDEPADADSTDATAHDTWRAKKTSSEMTTISEPQANEGEMDLISFGGEASKSIRQPTIAPAPKRTFSSASSDIDHDATDSADRTIVAAKPQPAFSSASSNFDNDTTSSAGQTVVAPAPKPALSYVSSDTDADVTSQRSMNLGGGVISPITVTSTNASGPSPQAQVSCWSSCGAVLPTTFAVLKHLESGACRIQPADLYKAAANIDSCHEVIDGRYLRNLALGHDLQKRYKGNAYPFVCPQCELVFQKLAALFKHVDDGKCMSGGGDEQAKAVMGELREALVGVCRAE